MYRKPFWNREYQIWCPCGQCEDCLKKRVQSWTLRMMHEHENFHGKASFITLTYRNEDLPEHFSLRKTDFQKYMKRFRKHWTGKVKYYACGEYGENRNRPHYHVIIFGIDPVAYKLLQDRKNIWPFGTTHIGHCVQAEACAYVAKYVQKMNRAKGADWTPRERPFSLQSKALGASYAQRYAQEIKKNST